MDEIEECQIICGVTAAVASVKDFVYGEQIGRAVIGCGIGMFFRPIDKTGRKKAELIRHYSLTL